MTRRRIPLFPLPGVVLLPGTMLPLHIFEPRYRSMVADALEGDRTIGMTMLKAGREEEGEVPAIHPIGGAGEIVECEPLEDGRYNILLEGKFRFRVVDEAPPDPYRVAQVEPMVSIPFADAAEQTRVLAGAVTLFSEVAKDLELPPLPDETLSPERLASELALRLRYAPPELQQILETDSLARRYETLLGRMLEWKGRVHFLAPFRSAGHDPRWN